MSLTPLPRELQPVQDTRTGLLTSVDFVNVDRPLDAFDSVIQRLEDEAKERTPHDLMMTPSVMTPLLDSDVTGPMRTLFGDEMEKRSHEDILLGFDVPSLGPAIVATTPWAAKQLVRKVWPTKYGMDYYRACAEQDEKLARLNLRVWLSEYKGEDALMRFMKDPTENGIARLRAVLGTGYRPYSDLEVMTDLATAIRNVGMVDDFEVVQVHWDPYHDRTQIKLLTKRPASMPWGEEMFGGISITHGETGWRALRVNGYVWRPWCKNGMVGLKASEIERVVHRGFTMREKVKRAIDAAVGSSESMITQLRHAATVEIDDLDASYDALAKTEKLSKVQTSQIRAQLEAPATGRYSAFDMLQSVTRWGRDKEPVTRLRVEEMAGRMMNRLNQWTA